MTRYFKLALIFVFVLVFDSCATSMSPVQVNQTLPTLTESKFISEPQLEKGYAGNRCKYLVKGRIYVAPIGSTVLKDLKYGAKGIDEWVSLDGGNAYVLKSFKWVAVDQGTQLHLVFDTLLCQ